MDLVAGYGRELLGLFVVFSLLGLTVWKLGRSRPPQWRNIFSGKTLIVKRPARERALETVERLALTPQHTLHVLRLRDREILVATHPQGCTLLDHATERARGVGA